MARPPRWVWRCVASFFLGALLATLGVRLLDRQAPQTFPIEPADMALREQNAALRQLQLVDREAQAVLRDQIARLSAQNGELNRRLALLRGVLAPDGQAPELGVADLLLRPQIEAGRVGYRLLLARIASPATDGKLSGRAELWSLGELDGRPQEIRVAQLRLALRRLQTFSGTLVLPAGFRPQRLRVVLEPRGQAPLPFEFAWQELIAAGQPMTAATPLP